MLISFSKKFIFIHNYKVAGSSIRKILAKYQPLYRKIVTAHPRTYKHVIVPVIKTLPDHFKNDFIKCLQFTNHATALEVKDKLSYSLFNNYYKFGFVRNPWDWTVSLYFYILSYKRHKTHKTVKNFKNFDEFVEWRCSEEYKSQFIYLQKDFFTDEEGNIIVDYIGKFENLNEDFDYIVQHLGLKNTSLPHKNKTKHKNYREYYNDYTRKLVEEQFKEDIELFNYEF